VSLEESKSNVIRLQDELDGCLTGCSILKLRDLRLFVRSKNCSSGASTYSYDWLLGVLEICCSLDGLFNLGSFWLYGDVLKSDDDWPQANSAELCTRLLGIWGM